MIQKPDVLDHIRLFCGLEALQVHRMKSPNRKFGPNPFPKRMAGPIDTDLNGF